MFFLTYIKKEKQLQNAFAEWGSFGHSLLERYYKDQLELFEIATQYEVEYQNKVVQSFPPNSFVDLAEKYYQDGLKYFSHFEGLPDHYIVLAVEKKISVSINSLPFVGIVDLILKDKTDNGIIIVDHKSKSKFKNKTEQQEYARQLYLYSMYVKEKYGVYPKELQFNMFRAGEVITIPFDINDLQKAVQWFTDTVVAIYQEIEFKDKFDVCDNLSQDDFFCNELCGSREICEQSICFKEGC